jgi:rubrerythrin
VQDKKLIEKMIRVLKAAIAAEQKAQEEYQKGAEVSFDYEVKQLFLELRDEEYKHERLLRERVKQIEKMLAADKPKKK